MKRYNAKRKGHAFPKNVDLDYRAWIGRLPCILRVAGCWSDFLGTVIDVAHVKSRGAGGADRNNLVPLCHFHHMQQHYLGIRSFQARYGMDLKVIARQLTTVYEAEVSGLAAPGRE